MDPETKRLLHRAIDAHDVALEQINNANSKMITAVELTAHSADVARNIADAMRVAFNESQATLSTVHAANRALLEALNRDEGQSET